MRNKGLRFICRHVNIQVASTATPFTAAAERRPNTARAHCACGWQLFLRRSHARRNERQRSDRFPLLRAQACRFQRSRQ